MVVMEEGKKERRKEGVELHGRLPLKIRQVWFQPLRKSRGRPVPAEAFLGYAVQPARSRALSPGCEFRRRSVPPAGFPLLAGPYGCAARREERTQPHGFPPIHDHKQLNP
jgi:hypothetical protein